MLRFISRLFKIDYDSCKACEVYKEQIRVVNEEKRDLLDNILAMVNPQTIPSVTTSPEPVKRLGMSWHQRRQILEAESKARARSMANQPQEVKDEINKLEKELEIVGEVGKNGEGTETAH